MTGGWGTPRRKPVLRSKPLPAIKPLPREKPDPDRVLLFTPEDCPNRDHPFSYECWLCGYHEPQGRATTEDADGRAGGER